MDIRKLQDLFMAVEGIESWDLKDLKNQAAIRRIMPKLLNALKEVALEVKCAECHGRGYLTGATGFEQHKRGKCPACRGTGSKYYFLELL